VLNRREDAGGIYSGRHLLRAVPIPGGIYKVLR
jgi:hypothetical protein